MTALGAQIVGQSLMLQCEVTFMRNITGNVDIVWRTDGAVLRRINVTTVTTMDNSLVYTDSYNISQLSTSHDGRVIECEVTNTHALFTASDGITLNVTSKC